MKLEEQCCSLEQAIKLYELGITQESLFYHTQNKVDTNSNLHHYGWAQGNMPVIIMYGKQSKISTSRVHLEYSAFTTSELGIMLPAEIEGAQLVQWSIPSKETSHVISFGTQYRVNPGNPFNGHVIPNHPVFGASEAEMRAKLLIELIELGMVDVQQLNERLSKNEK